MGGPFPFPLLHPNGYPRVRRAPFPYSPLATLSHPASLNALQQFSQACSILVDTTRATNPAWYQEALELNHQLHIRCDGAQISCFYFDRKKNLWSQGPSIAPEIIEDPARLDNLVAEALRTSKAAGATSLGVILHVADEFATTELKPELDNPAALPDLRSASYTDPASILEDSSIVADQAAWRVVPYSAAGSDVIGTTVSITKQHTAFLSAFRLFGEKENFPIITHALSSPLVAIMGLTQAVKPTPGRSFAAILQYPWFTTMAFFNEHADLRLIRTLQHRGVRRATNFRNALNTTCASLEFVDPDIFLVPLGQEIDSTLEANLRITFTTSRVEQARLPRVDGLPEWAPELVFATTPPPASAATTPSHTFTVLREEKWALQDFLPTPKEIIEIYPNRSEMKLLRVLRLARVGLVAIAILSLAYISFGVIDLVRRPEWSFDPVQSGVMQTHLSKLDGERRKLDHWNNLLEDRSKAWVSMESLARMFAENGGMLVKSYSHTAKPDNTPGQAKVGFVKEWKITGFARDEALEYLNNLNTREGINAHFGEIARITGNASYSPTTGNRNITVNVRTQENNTFKPAPPEETSVADETTYPFTFDMTITQRFEATDPMAITVPKAP